MYSNSIKFILRDLCIVSRTSNTTSTSGTFPLYLIKDLDEWGISLGRGILCGVRAVSCLSVCVSPTPALPRSFYCLTVEERAVNCHCQGIWWCAGMQGTSALRYNTIAPKNHRSVIYSSHVFCISQLCYWTSGFFSCLNDAVNLYSTVNYFFICNNICHWGGM